MRVDIVCKPSYSAAYCILEAGESVMVEREAMVAMDLNFKVNAGMGGSSILQSGLRKALGGESFFMGRYEALMSGAWLLLAPGFPGDVEAVQIDHGATLKVEPGCLLAASQGLEVDVKLSGVTKMLMREGATQLKLTGHGTALIAAYGGIQKISLEAGQSIAVDTGHIVATTGHIQLATGTLGNVATTNIIGEGMVASCTGPGDVWIQTRAVHSFRNWLLPGTEKDGRNRTGDKP